MKYIFHLFIVALFTSCVISFPQEEDEGPVTFDTLQSKYNELKFSRWSRELSKKQFNTAKNPKISGDMKRSGVLAHYRHDDYDFLIYNFGENEMPSWGFLNADLSNTDTSLPFRLSSKNGFVDILYLVEIDTLWYKFRGIVSNP